MGRSHFAYPFELVFFHPTFGLLWIMLLWTRIAQISLWDLAFSSLEFIPRNGVAGSYGNSMFNFLRICHRVFYRSCSILQSHHLFLNFLYSGHPSLDLSLYFLFLWVTIHPGIGTLPSFYVVIYQILIHSFNKRHAHWVLFWVERNRSKQALL